MLVHVFYISCVLHVMLVHVFSCHKCHVGSCFLHAMLVHDFLHVMLVHVGSCFLHVMLVHVKHHVGS